MNERIRELLNQATQYADSLGPIDGAEWCDAEYSKFAELIIRECMDVVCDINQEYDGGSTVVNAAEVIKEYFGIES